MKHVALTQHTLITCMEVIKKNSDDIDAVGMLVVGTGDIKRAKLYIYIFVRKGVLINYSRWRFPPNTHIP